MTRPPEIENLLKVCGQFREGEIDIKTLQRAASLAASVIPEPARNNLREFIDSAEEELDFIQVTSISTHAETLRLIDRLERMVEREYPV